MVEGDPAAGSHAHDVKINRCAGHLAPVTFFAMWATKAPGSTAASEPNR